MYGRNNSSLSRSSMGLLMAIRHSDPISLVAKGSGAGYLTNGAAVAGSTGIAIDTGTGTILSGDIVTLNGDTNKYVVNSALAGGAISIGKPGLLLNAADGAALTVGNSYTPNVAFARSAIVLATRAPAKPEGGDSADDTTIITDPVTGLSFEIAVYRQFLQVVYHAEGSATITGKVRTFTAISTITVTAP